MKWFHKKVFNFVFIVLTERVKSISGRALQSLGILYKYEVDVMQLSVALWKSLVSDDLVAPLTKDT